MSPVPNHKAKILFLEDEAFIGQLYSRALTNAGYRVSLVADGRQGLEQALNDSFDIILLDLMLPKLSGINILKTLRENSKADVKARIIVMTNLEYQGKNREDIERLADGYLLKANTTPRQLVEFLDKVSTNS